MNNVEKKEVGDGEESISQKSQKWKTKIFFWIFAFFGVLFSLAFWVEGFPSGSFLMIFLWLIFLICVWRIKKFSLIFLTLTLVFGIVLVLWSILFFDDSKVNESSSQKENSQATEKIGNLENEEMCDESNSQYADFNGVEEVIVSKNPCKVPWILAKEVESYSLKTKNGKDLKALVWNNYVNNVQAGESYTIRVLDIEDSGTLSDKDKRAGIAIVRWVKNKSELSKAKAEVQDVVENLDF